MCFHALQRNKYCWAKGAAPTTQCGCSCARPESTLSSTDGHPIDSAEHEELIFFFFFLCSSNDEPLNCVSLTATDWRPVPVYRVKSIPKPVVQWYLAAVGPGSVISASMRARA